LIDVLTDLIKAFVVGGLFCAIAQVIIDKTKLTPARILVSYVVIGVLLSGIGVYDKLVSFAGAGATTPLTGFGYCLAKGVKQAVDKDGPIGIITGGIKGASGGITAAILLGVISSLIFKSKPK
jgi:stage V sporulation protein AE